MKREYLIQLTNRRAQVVLDGDWGFQDDLNEILKYRKPGWDYTYKARYNGWDGYTPMVSEDGSMGTGAFLALRNRLERELKVKFIVKDLRKEPEAWKVLAVTDTEFESRRYQLECVNKMMAHRKTGGLILNATGTGKTFIAGKYFSWMKGTALFLVDELTLLKQNRQELEDVLREKVGEIGNSRWETKRVTVGTIQTVHRHRFDPQYVPWTKRLDCIVIDEVHLALNRRNFETIRAIRPPTIFGLTATLELKKKHVAHRAYELCGPVLFTYPLKQGVEEGFLAKGIAVAVKVENEQDSDGFAGSNFFARRVHFRQRYAIEYPQFIVEGKKRNKVIADLVAEAYKRGKHTVVLLERVQHLKDLSAMLKVPHHLVFGEKTVEERRESQALFEKEKVRVILANKVFSKGINIKRIDVMIDGAGMKSRNGVIQKYGRGIRLCDGKEGLIYFDISDVGNRFEKAAKVRRSTLKRIGISVYLADSSIGAARLLELAEKRLREERDAGSVAEHAQGILPGFELGKNSKSKASN